MILDTTHKSPDLRLVSHRQRCMQSFQSAHYRKLQLPNTYKREDRRSHEGVVEVWRSSQRGRRRILVKQFTRRRPWRKHDTDAPEQQRPLVGQRPRWAAAANDPGGGMVPVG